MATAQTSAIDANLLALGRSWATAQQQNRRPVPEDQITSQLASSSTGPPVAGRLLASLALGNPSSPNVSNADTFSNLHVWPSAVAHAVFPPRSFVSNSAQRGSSSDAYLFDECAVALSGLRVSLTKPTDTTSSTPLEQCALGLHIEPPGEQTDATLARIPKTSDYNLAPGNSPELQFEAELCPGKAKAASERARVSVGQQAGPSSTSKVAATARKAQRRAPRPKDPFVTVPLGRNSFHAAAPSLARRNSINRPNLKPTSTNDIRPSANVRTETIGPLQNKNNDEHTLQPNPSAAEPEEEPLQHEQERVEVPNQIPGDVDVEDDIIDIGVGLGPEEDLDIEDPRLDDVEENVGVEDDEDGPPNRNGEIEIDAHGDDEDTGSGTRKGPVTEPVQGETERHDEGLDGDENNDEVAPLQPNPPANNEAELKGDLRGSNEQGKVVKRVEARKAVQTNANAEDEEDFLRDENGEILRDPQGRPVRPLGSKKGKPDMDSLRAKLREMERLRGQRLHERKKEVVPAIEPTDTGYARLEQRRQKLEKRKETVQAQKERKKAMAEREMEKKRKIAKKKKKRTAAQKGQAYVSDSEEENDSQDEDAGRRTPPQNSTNVIEILDDSPHSHTSPASKRQRMDSPASAHQQHFARRPNDGRYLADDQYPWGGDPRAIRGPYDGDRPGSEWSNPGLPSRGAHPVGPPSAGPSSVGPAPYGKEPYHSSYGTHPPYLASSYGSHPPYPPYPPQYPGGPYPPPQSQYGFDPRYGYHPPYRQGFHGEGPGSFAHPPPQHALRPRLPKQQFIRKRSELHAAIRACSKDLTEADSREIDDFLDNQMSMFGPGQEERDYVLEQKGNTLTKLRVYKNDGTWLVVKTRVP